MSGKLSALSISFIEASQRMRLEHQSSGLSAALTMPVFEIEGQSRNRYHLIDQAGVSALSNGAQEQVLTLRGGRWVETGSGFQRVSLFASLEDEVPPAC